MLEAILTYLNFYPNFLRQIPTGWWMVLGVLALWRAVLSWRIHIQTGLRCYVFGTVAAGLAAMGFFTAPIGHTVLQLVMLSAPLLTAAFVIGSISDARSWFSDEAADKYWLLRHGSLPLRLWGQVPKSFQRRPGPGATRQQAVKVSVLTLLFMGFTHYAVCQTSLGALSPRSLLIITVAVAMASFHAVMLGLFGLLYGTSVRRVRQPKAGC